MSKLLALGNAVLLRDTKIGYYVLWFDMHLLLLPSNEAYNKVQLGEKLNGKVYRNVYFKEKLPF